jgi:hypothetical protein
MNKGKINILEAIADVWEEGANVASTKVKRNSYTWADSFRCLELSEV